MTILLLAWPVFVEQIFTTLVSFADTAMVGSLGAEATAAISISNSPVFLLNGLIMSLGVGITALVARATGRGDEEAVRKLMRHALLAIVYVGIPITLVVIALYRQIPLWMGADASFLDTAARYNLIVSCGRIFSLTAMILNSAFRGYGDTKTPMKANLILNIVNVIGNFLLIYPTRIVPVLGIDLTMPGAGLGVEGAAIATAVGMAVSNDKSEADAYETIPGIAADFMADASFNSNKMWEYWPQVGEITDKAKIGVIPAGYANLGERDEDGAYPTASFFGMYEYAVFWTADLVEDEPGMAYYRYIICDQPDMYVGKGDINTFGASVRCVRDTK